MADRELQLVVDSNEENAARGYAHGQLLAGIVEEAVRRADAMSRLDARLRMLGLGGPHSPT